MNMLFAPPVTEIQLRPYQADVVEKLRSGIRAGCRRQVLVAPTAAGKTEMAMKVIQEAQRKGSRTWFIVDRVSLIDQTSERFARHGIDHGVIQADHFLTDYGKTVQIASAQTLARRKVDDDLLPSLIVIDECHCAYKSTAEIVARVPNAKVIGLTATPFTKGMADDWDGLVNSVTVNELLKQKYLAPLKIKACVAPNMVGAKKKFTGEYEDEEAGSRGITIIGDVVNTWIEQTQKHFGGPAKTIVFSPSVKHGAELCRQFQAAGFNFQQISYLDADDDARRVKIAEFRKPNSTIDGLVSCAVLTKGFDVPDVKVGISCRPYRKSFSSHIQEMGRVMRISPGKEYGLWLDHSGNVISFADDTAWLFENGVDSLSSAQKKDSEVREPKENVRKERFCAECGMKVEGPSCSACGWTRPERGEIQFVQGDLIDVLIGAGESFKPRQGLRAECLKHPKQVWNAALSYCMANSRRGPDAARKWAMGIFYGVYPGNKLPRGIYDLQPNHSTVTPEQYGLIDREVQKFRRQGKKKAAA
jgi:DNA repair protein RadD